MERAYQVIDTFTSERFAGNPAAVVPDAVGLSDEQMQAIAVEFNLSETTFILPPESTDADVRFRWFTPGMEVDMCGHATIAGIHSLFESGQVPSNGGAASLRIETRSGILDAVIEDTPETGRLIWLDLPKPQLEEVALPVDELAPVLGLEVDAIVEPPPLLVTQDKDVIVFVRDFLTLNEAKPDFGRLLDFSHRHGLRGVSVATTKTVTPSVNVQSRFFAPAAGVDEDPVTGSVHGPLAAAMVKYGLVPIHGETAGMTCVQAKAGGRAGLIRALVEVRDNGAYTVKIAGQAITTMRGVLLEG